MKFKLNSIDKAGKEVTHQFEASSLPDILTNVEAFLKGSGFYIDQNEHVVIWDESLEELTAISAGEWGKGE